MLLWIYCYVYCHHAAMIRKQILFMAWAIIKKLSLRHKKLRWFETVIDRLKFERKFCGITHLAVSLVIYYTGQQKNISFSYFGAEWCPEHDVSFSFSLK